MTVNQERHFAIRWAAPGVLVILVLAGSVALSARAQAQNPTSAADPFWGSVTAQPVTGEPLKLSLDDAVRRGFKNNLGLKEAENDEKSLHGEKNEVLQEFLPTIALTGDTGYHMYDLAALGFRAKIVSGILDAFPGGKIPAGFSNITRVDADRRANPLQRDSVFRSCDCRLEGGGRSGTVSEFRQDYGARRGGAAGSDCVSARDCR